MSSSQNFPSNRTPSADAAPCPKTAEQIEQQLRHIYQNTSGAIEMRHVGYSHIDDVLDALEVGKSCLDVEQLTGIGHNHVRAILRGEFLKWHGDERVPMTGRQQSRAAKIRMMKHPKQIRSIDKPIPRPRHASVSAFNSQPAANSVDPKHVMAGIAAMYEDRLAELENENKRMRDQLLDMHMRLMA